MTSHKLLKQWFRVGAVCLGALLVPSSCIDSDYDLDRVDLTMGLGSDGLSVKLGNTEKIYLETIIDTDETVKLDKANLYYLIKDGQTNINVNVAQVSANLEETAINTSNRVFTFEDLLEQNGLPETVKELPVEAGLQVTGTIEAAENIKFKVENISPDILSVTHACVEDVKLSLEMKLVASPMVKFDVNKITDFQIELPQFLQVKSVPQGWTLNGQTLKFKGDLSVRNTLLCELVVSGIELGKHGVPQNGVIELPAEQRATNISGKVSLVAAEAFTMHVGDYTDLCFSLGIAGDKRIQVVQATGRFNPAINPEVSPIQIAESLPDFLKGEDVRITAANPTVKFMADMQNIPVDIDFSARFISQKNGAESFKRELDFPSVSLSNRTYNTVYYHQAEQPYDPEGTVEGAICQQVADINSLIKVLPDFLEVDLKDGKVRVQPQQYTIDLGKDYQAQADYKVFVPFEFSQGLVIVYNDSTNSFNKDVEDYAAHGVRVNAKIENTIPLELEATAYAVDVMGNRIPGVRFTKALVAPSTDGVSIETTEIEIDGDLDAPELLKKVDRIYFTIHATDEEATRNHQLYSTQYLQVKDMRLRLKGQIIADLN